VVRAVGDVDVSHGFVDGAGVRLIQGSRSAEAVRTTSDCASCTAAASERRHHARSRFDVSNEIVARVHGVDVAMKVHGDVEKCVEQRVATYSIRVATSISKSAAAGERRDCRRRDDNFPHGVVASFDDKHVAAEVGRHSVRLIKHRRATNAIGAAGRSAADHAAARQRPHGLGCVRYCAYAVVTHVCHVNIDRVGAHGDRPPKRCRRSNAIGRAAKERLARKRGDNAAWHCHLSNDEIARICGGAKKGSGWAERGQDRGWRRAAGGSAAQRGASVRGAHRGSWPSRRRRHAPATSTLPLLSTAPRSLGLLNLAAVPAPSA
jgi:hypothetical protein